MGCTEGVGSFFITPQLSHFVDAYPAISVDILPLPHFISLSKREADIVIALERPEHGPYVCCKLCDYRLQHTYGPCSGRSEEHTSELQSLMRISYAVFC